MQPFVSMPPEVVAAVSLKNSQTKKGNKRVRLLRPKPIHVDGDEVKKSMCMKWGNVDGNVLSDARKSKYAR